MSKYRSRSSNRKAGSDPWTITCASEIIKQTAENPEIHDVGLATIEAVVGPAAKLAKKTGKSIGRFASQIAEREVSGKGFDSSSEATQTGIHNGISALAIASIYSHRHPQGTRGEPPVIATQLLQISGKIQPGI